MKHDLTNMNDDNQVFILLFKDIVSFMFNVFYRDILCDIPTADKTLPEYFKAFTPKFTLKMQHANLL